MTTIAVTAATGQLGQIAIQKLAKQTNVIALARNLEKAKDLGVEVRHFDYDSPAVASLQGVDKLYLISGSELGKRAEQHKKVIDAAKQAGVKHIVYTSLLHADHSSLNVAQEHKPTEKDLQESGVPFTILRNGWYTENYTASIPAALQLGAFYGAAGEGKIASASREDFVDAAIRVLTTDGHEGKTYELAGDNAYTLSELAAEMSRQIGKDIPYVDLSEQDYAKALTEAGVPADFAAIIAHWDIDAKNGALFSDDKTLSTLIGRSTTSLAEMVKIALAK